MTHAPAHDWRRRLRKDDTAAERSTRSDGCVAHQPRQGRCAGSSRVRLLPAAAAHCRAGRGATETRSRGVNERRHPPQAQLRQMGPALSNPGPRWRKRTHTAAAGTSHTGTCSSAQTWHSRPPARTERTVHTRTHRHERRLHHRGVFWALYSCFALFLVRPVSPRPAVHAYAHAQVSVVTGLACPSRFCSLCVCVHTRTHGRWLTDGWVLIAVPLPGASTLVHTAAAACLSRPEQEVSRVSSGGRGRAVSSKKRQTKTHSHEAVSKTKKRGGFGTRTVSGGKSGPRRVDRRHHTSGASPYHHTNTQAETESSGQSRIAPQRDQRQAVGGENCGRDGSGASAWALGDLMCCSCHLVHVHMPSAISDIVSTSSCSLSSISLHSVLSVCSMTMRLPLCCSGVSLCFAVSRVQACASGVVRECETVGVLDDARARSGCVSERRVYDW